MPQTLSTELPRIIPATFARILAALIDCFVIAAFLLLGSKFFDSVDWGFLITLLCGLIYYSLGNSWITEGQTLGKKVFGLRVVCWSSDGIGPYISIQKSFLRYLVLFGFIIVCSELPFNIYRFLDLAASPALLELNKLLAMVFAFANFTCFLLDKQHRAVHDYCCNTTVLRCFEKADKSTIAAQLSNYVSEHFVNEPTSASPLKRSAIIGLLLAVLFWWPGVNHPEQLNAVHTHRFRIERRFPIRITSLQANSSTLKLTAILPNSHEVSFQKATSKQDTALKVVQFLKNEGIVSSQAPSSIVFELHFLNDDKSLNELNLKINTKTLAIEKLESARPAVKK